MSRIGKKPITVPADVKVVVNDTVINFSKGKNSVDLDTKGNVGISFEDNTLTFSPNSMERVDRAFWGTYRALSNNVITGLVTGYKKSLEINGVGYRAAVKGKILNLQLGHSHDINFDIPEGLTISVEKNIVHIEGIDKQLVGQTAAKIRAFRPPEPYKGKGVKYVEEHIVRKAGKTAKK